MAVISLGFYNPETGAHIGTLDDSQLIAVELRPALYELGAIKLTVSRHLAEASTAVLRKGNIVAVTIPEVQATPFCGFILKDDAADLISRNEQGGEHLTLSGPGLLEVLRGARLLEETYAPVPPASEERGSSTEPGVWRWASQPYGAIFTRAIEEGQNQPGEPLALVDITFDRGDDSDNVDWYEIGQDYQLSTGTDVLTAGDTLAQAGDFYLVATPIVTGSNLRIRVDAHQTYGDDLSGSFGAGTVRFEKGVNLLTELKRESRQTRITHLLTRDMDAVFTEHVTSQPYDEARWGYLDVGQTNDPALTAKIAATTLAATDEESEEYSFEAAPGSTPASGLYLPFKHYRPGDYVTLDTGSGAHDLNASKQRVIGVRIVLDSAADDDTATKAHRSLRIVPELSYRNTRGMAGNNPPVTEGGNPSCNCPKPCRPGTEGSPATTVHHWPFLGSRNCSIHDAHPFHNGGVFDGLADGYMFNHIIQTDQIQVQASDKASATAGTTYIVNASAGNYAERAGELITVRVRWYNGPDTIGDHAIIGTTTGVGLNPVSASVTAPAGTDGMTIMAGRVGGSSNQMYLGPVTVSLDDAVAGTPGSGHPDAVGTSVQYSRCDHGHDYHRDTTPTPDDDETSGYKVGETWVQLDDLDSPTRILGEWVLVDATEGAAIWLPKPIGGASGGSNIGWFNVRNFGAAGDGTTNDTSAINDAIAALNAAGRGVLYFPAGNYLVSSALTAISVPCTVAGDGMAGTDAEAAYASRITTTSGTIALLTIASHAVTIRDLALVNNAGSEPMAGGGIVVTSGNHTRIHRVSVKGFYINVDFQDGYGWTVDHYFGMAAAQYDLKARHIDLPDGGDWAIDNSWFYSDDYNAEAAIRIESGGGGKITNTKINAYVTLDHQFANGIDLAVSGTVQTSVLLIANNSIENVSGHAIKATQADTAQYRYTVIDGNQVGLYSNNAGKAISIVAEDAAGFADIAISSNVFTTDGTARSAIQLTNIDNVTLNGNVLARNFTSLYTNSGSMNIVEIGGGGGGGGGAFSDLTDVTVTSPVAGDQPRWNGTAWVNTGPLICVDPGSITVDDSGPFGITLTTDWGVDSGGAPYHDDTGADAGEEAALFYDPLTGNYCLISYDFP